MSELTLCGEACSCWMWIGWLNEIQTSPTLLHFDFQGLGKWSKNKTHLPWSDNRELFLSSKEVLAVSSLSSFASPQDFSWRTPKLDTAWVCPNYEDQCPHLCCLHFGCPTLGLLQASVQFPHSRSWLNNKSSWQSQHHLCSVLRFCIYIISIWT